MRLWNLETGESRVLASHPGPVYGIAFTPDGRSDRHDQPGGDLLRIWDVATGAWCEPSRPGWAPSTCSRSHRMGGTRSSSPASAPRAQLWDLEQGTSLTLEHDGS